MEFVNCIEWCLLCATLRSQRTPPTMTVFPLRFSAVASSIRHVQLVRCIFCCFYRVEVSVHCRWRHLVAIVFVRANVRLASSELIREWSQAIATTAITTLSLRATFIYCEGRLGFCKHKAMQTQPHLLICVYVCMCVCVRTGVGLPDQLAGQLRQISRWWVTMLCVCSHRNTSVYVCVRVGVYVCICMYIRL